MTKIDAGPAHPVAWLLGAIGLVTVFFLLDQRYRKGRRTPASQPKPWVNENPPLEVSRHG
jgi:hypothetical protein